MTFAEGIDAVAALGFTRRAATFLTIVLRHGGYFMRRQYCAFAGVHHGLAETSIVSRLVGRQFVRRLACSAHRGCVYRLCGPLFAAADLEYRSGHGVATPALIARKLMLLDFVLTEPNLDWYATSAEKGALFAGRLGLPETLFPRKTGKTTHYWPQDLPVFVLGDPPQVQFVCLAADPHASAVGAFVRQHAALLQQLSGWTLHAVVPRGSVVDGACEKAYERALHSTLLALAPDADRQWFERTRPLVDAGEISDLSVADLRRYRELATRIGNGIKTSAAGPMVVHVLRHSYINFGSFPGLV